VIDEEMKTFRLKREIFRSGFSIDGRFMSRSLVRRIFKNTKKELINKGILIPLKLGHDDRDQRLKGKVIDLKLKKKLKPKLRTFEYSIHAELEMFEDAYTMFQKGELPNLSVEISPFGFDENGKEFGDHIFALALLGTDSPALPWLLQKYEDMAFCYSLLPNTKKEFQQMDPEKILAILEQMESSIAELRGMIAPDDEGDDDAEESEKDEKEANPENSDESSFEDKSSDDKDSELPESEARIKELEQQVKDLQAEKTFNELHAGGKIASDQKSQFKALVKKTDISFAIGHYNQSKTKAPPQNKQTKSSSPKQANKQQVTEYWNNFYTKKYKMSGDQLEKYTKLAVEKQLAKESTNGSNR
jgi:hypothetical protein